MKNLDPSIVVLPYCYDQESNNIYLMQWRKSVFINLNWEQFFYKGNVKAKTPKGEFPLKYVKQVVWSENFKKILKNKKVLKTNIFVSGNPYLGLYNRKYIKYFKSRAQIENEFGINKNDYLIFFPENYNWAFYSKKMLEQMVKNGQSKKQVYEMKKYTYESFKIAMKW